MERLQSENSFAMSEGGASTISTQSMMDALAKIPGPKVECSVDCFVPKQMAAKMEAAGIKKGKDMDVISTFILAIHAGMFVSFGAAFFTVVHSSAADQVGHFGLIKFAGGLSFCTGLAMVILCGSELFTGNALMTMAWCANKITTFQMCKNWLIVWFGNCAGSVIMAAIQVWGRTYENAAGQVGRNALDICQAKCNREWGQCIALGILCNIMVCWAVWMTLSGHTATDKLLVFILPITAFAAMGFEHSIANQYFLPVAWIIKHYASPSFWTAINKKPEDYDKVDIGVCIYMNLIPATLGNSAGAIFFVGLVYWYLYLRDADHVSRLQFQVGSVRIFASPPDPYPPKKKKAPK